MWVIYNQNNILQSRFKSEMRRQFQNEQLKIKIILVGDSGVGKSNIRERLCQDRFDPFSVTTVGIQVSNRKFYAPFQQRQQRFNAFFWDGAGKLQNKELIPSFFKSITAVIYVYDITNKITLEHLKLWKNKVQQRNYNNRIYSLLIGNKKDLKNFREVTPQIALKYQKQLRIDKCCEVSALDTASGSVQIQINQFIEFIAQNIQMNSTKPTKLRQIEAHHRSCI